MDKAQYQSILNKLEKQDTAIPSNISIGEFTDPELEGLEKFYNQNRIRQADSLNNYSIYNDPQLASTILNSSVPLSQLEKNLRQSKGGTLEPYNPTLREDMRTGISDAGEYMGLSRPSAQNLAKGFLGNPSAETFGKQVGLIDLTPFAIPFYAQEGIRAFQRGDNISGAIDTTAAVLEGALYTKPIAKSLKALSKSLSSKIKGDPSKKMSELASEIQKNQKNLGALPSNKVMANTKLQAPSMAMVNPRKIDNFGFFYKTEELANTMKQNKGSGSDFLKFFQGKGITKAELDDTGLEDLFKQESVTKSDILKTIDLNRIKLSQTVYANDGVTDGGNLIFEDMTKKLSETPSFNKYSSYEIEEFEDTVTDGKNFYGEKVNPQEQIPTRVLEDAKTGYRILFDEKGNRFLTYNKDANIFDISESEQAKALIDEHESLEGFRFDEIAQKGNINEATLVTEATAIQNGAYKTLNPRFESETQVGGTNYKEYVLKRPPLLNKRGAKNNKNEKYSNIADFQEPIHYDDYNPIFHVRTKDRYDGNRKILYVEELQSDWGQQGRNKGFAKSVAEGGGSYQSKPRVNLQKKLDGYFNDVLSYKDQSINLNAEEQELLYKLKNPGKPPIRIPLPDDVSLLMAEKYNQGAYIPENVYDFEASRMPEEFKTMKMSDYLDFTRTIDYRRNISKNSQNDNAYPDFQNSTVNQSSGVDGDLDLNKEFADMTEGEQELFILNFGLRSLGNDRYNIKGSNKFTNKEELSDYLDNLNNNIDDAQRLLLRGNVPTAAFVTDTKDWTKLGIKRLLQQAVEGGYDSISFSPGKIQADRWSNDGLIKYYDEIIPSVAEDVVGAKNVSTEIVPIKDDATYFVRQTDTEYGDPLYQVMKSTGDVDEEGIMDAVPIKRFEDGMRAQNYVNSINKTKLQPSVTITINDDLRQKVLKGLSLFTMGAGTAIGLEDQIGALGDIPSTQGDET